MPNRDGRRPILLKGQRIRRERQERAVLHSVACADPILTVGVTIRIDLLNDWPEYEIIGQDEDGAFVVRPLPPRPPKTS